MLAAGVVEGAAAEPECLASNFAPAKLEARYSGSAAAPSTTPAVSSATSAIQWSNPRSEASTAPMLLYYSTTILLYYYTTLLLYYSTTILLYNYTALLLYYSTTILLYYYTTLLLYYSTTILLHNYATLLIYYSTTILPYYHTTILPPYYHTTILPYYYTTILLYNYTTLLPYYHTTTILPYYHTTILLFYNTTPSTILLFQTTKLPYYYTTIYHIAIQQSRPSIGSFDCSSTILTGLLNPTTILPYPTYYTLLQSNNLATGLDWKLQLLLYYPMILNYAL